MYSDTGNTTSLVLGFPIRTSSDQRSVGSSPRHIAASHVLHRPLMPRHPPCALKHLQHKNQKSKNNSEKITPQQPTTTPNANSQPPQRETTTRRTTNAELDARNHYPRIKHHTPPPKPGATTRLPPHTGAREPRACCLKPNSVLDDSSRHPAPHEAETHDGFCVRLHMHQNPHPLQVERSISRIVQDSPNSHRCGRARNTWCSLERR